MASHPLFADTWWENNLLDESFVEQITQQLLREQPPEALAQWLQQSLSRQPFEQLARLNESQLEHGFIWPLLEHMGWHAVPQQSYTVQGKQAKPDWSLVLAPEQKQALIAAQEPAQKAAHITAICEAKAWDVLLDNGKANPANPHHQLQEYLATLRVRFGILTNGRVWRLYDTQEITARKTYLQIDLQAVLALPDDSADSRAEKARALARFGFFFGRNTYVPPAQGGPQRSPLAQAIEAAQLHALAVEENLKAVIYGYDGEDSLFEHIGLSLWRANARRQPSLDKLYENTVVFLFRLLFIVYFEDRNKELLAAHPFYQRYSLKNLYWRLRDERTTCGHLFDGVYALKQLFAMLDQGAEDIDIPLFNGGLFDPERAPMLLAPKIFDNASLCGLLEKLLFKTHRGNTLFDTPRDFNTMSVTHLGRIYEGLLEFRFERASDNETYLEYASSTTKGKPVEAYFDAYDAAVVRKEKGFRALREVHVKKGQIKLKSASNSRKSSASFYTPSSLSDRLVKAGIDQALARGRPLMDLRVLDNACGSGHFLVQALAYLTDLGLQGLAHDATLAQLLQDERSKIEEQLLLLNIPQATPSDAQILKRLLLKRCIYGVDLNPFAVELARLSLWMDSFIFGTPLSFIEHHIRHGNALLGASIEDFVAYNRDERGQGDLFVQDLQSRFDELRQVMNELDQLRDSTAEEVGLSKAKWRDDIAPRLAVLSRTLDFVSARRLLLAQGDKTAVQALDKTPDLLDVLFDAPLKVTVRSHPALQMVAGQSRRWHFFHYEVAFPEVFGGPQTQRGFDVIVGNPPWDKTKFSDLDFFPQYNNRYRQFKDSEKAREQQRLLAIPHIRQAYDKAQAEMLWVNEAYKAAYPLNKGSGDGNLFRFFVERNLGLLTPGGSLNYCLPSALMFEEGSLALRQHIVQHHQMRFFHSFENRDGLFPDVDSRYKFALTQIVREAPLPDAVIDTAFYVLDPAELDDAQRHVPYPVQTLQALSPQQWALMELRDGADLPLLARCYSAFAPLSERWLDFRNELHMTNDKVLFIEKPRAGLLPLFEGKMIWQYSHRLAEPTRWLEPQAFDEALASKELHRMAQDLDLKKSEVAKHAQAIRYDREFVRLGFRAVASDTNERTLIFALLPKNCGFGHSMFCSAAKTYRRNEDGQPVAQAQSILRLLFAMGWFNALPTDWLARQMVQINVSLTYLYRLPMPQPSDADILADARWRTLARNALLLTLTASWDDFAADLAPALQALQVQRSDVPTTAKAQDSLRAANDALVAAAYGLSAADMTHILHSFAGMHNKRPEYTVALHAAFTALQANGSAVAFGSAHLSVDNPNTDSSIYED